ncbi:MAG: DUF3854 domain-containing protein [Clostridiales bacterium]|nr:DUF3854 domain-containing protein [Clostridiales bacterium]
MDAELARVLDRLDLSPEEEAALSRRGFPPPIARELGYRSYEEERWPKRGKLPIWLPRGAGWVLAAPAGLLIPFRDQEGRLVGLQVRPRDQSGNKGKYRQVSAGGFPASVHVSRLGEGSPRVWITEGALKADIASLYTGERFIGLPGVSSFRGLEEALKGLRPQKVVLAFDADYGDNPHVRRSLQHLSEMLSLSGWRVRWAVWEKSLGKGIDDVLTEGHGGQVRIQASPPFAR